MIRRAFRRHARRRLRRAMRGYGALRREGRLTALAGLMAALTTSRLDDGRPSPAIYGAAYPHAEIATRQYLLIRVMGSTALNAAVLRAMGSSRPVVHPLPAEWRRILQAQGFAVARRRSASAWWTFVLLMWAYGCLTIARIFARGVAQSFRRASDVLHPYAAFVALKADNLPQPAADGRSHDIVTWYSQWEGRTPGLATLAHSVPDVPPASAGGTPVLSTPSLLPPPGGLALIAWSVWALGAAARALADAARGRWWHAVMLSEAAQAAAVRLDRARPLAVEYLFHGSNVIYRPLWSYEAEARGAALTFYFYSTNSEAFKRADGYTAPLHSWQVMTWPRILVWNEWQAAFVRRAIGNRARIDVVGPIWFQSSPREMPGVPAGAIAVFDVQPQRTSRFRTLGAPDEFYTHRVAAAFLRDVHAAAVEGGRAIAFKRKRHIGPLMHRGYGRLVERLAAEPSFITVDPGIHAIRVIEQCAAVVSMPFTSTALVARHYGKPSIYYDPSGMVWKDDRAAHGIPIVTGPVELRAWMDSLPPTHV